MKVHLYLLSFPAAIAAQVDQILCHGREGCGDPALSIPWLMIARGEQMKRKKINNRYFYHCRWYQMEFTQCDCIKTTSLAAVKREILWKNAKIPKLITIHMYSVSISLWTGTRCRVRNIITLHCDRKWRCIMRSRNVISKKMVYTTEQMKQYIAAYSFMVNTKGDITSVKSLVILWCPGLKNNNGIYLNIYKQCFFYFSHQCIWSICSEYSESGLKISLRGSGSLVASVGTIILVPRF